MKDTVKEIVKDTVIETPLIGSGSQEEVDSRVQALLLMGTSRGYLTYEELNERLPDEVVSPDKLDSLLMMIDEMGIKLIDDQDVGEFAKGPKAKLPVMPVPKKRFVAGDALVPPAPMIVKKDEEGGPEADDDDEDIDLNLEAELAE